MGKRILIVEDNFGDRMILRDHLASFGYSVVGEAKTIDESIEKYDKVRPDLVLIDAVIPDVDGVSAIMRILQVDYAANIIVCVTRGQQSLAMEALAAGAKDFITKPINPRTLHKAVQKAIG
ncbi:MAG: response regulator [Armatimonadota bacterium]